MPKKLHQLKIDYDYALPKVAGIKPFEIRMNDRGYQEGDLVCYEVINKNKAKNEEELKRVMELEKQIFIIEYVLDAATCKFGIRPSYVVFFEKEYQGDTFDYVADMIDDISKTITEVSTTPIEQARVAASQLILRGYRHDKYADCRNVKDC